MSENNQRQLDVTRDKLRLLEQTCAELLVDSTGTAHTRELTLRSLKGLINQLKEEIARHEAHAGAPNETP
jgi:hypothetical protein